MNQPTTKTIQSHSTILLSVLIGFLSVIPRYSVGQEAKQEPAKTVAERAAELAARQTNLADRYKTLEQKLFKLHEFELFTNPDRARLLKQAYQTSQDQLTQRQLSSLVEKIADKQWRDAITGQELALADLKALLKLLESEDRSKRIRDRQDQVKEYIAEVDRIMRIQKGIRGQNEGGVDPKRLAKSQNKAAQRAKDLNKRMKDDEGELEENDSQSEGKDGEKSDGEKSDGEKSDGEKSDGEKSDGEKSDGQKSDGQKGQPGQSDQQNKEKENPVQNRIQAAEERMRKAEENLKNAKRDESTREMEKAEQELAQAKKELEEILRQLREEEVERSLSSLEDRFRRMLEQQLRIQEKTKLYAKTATDQRDSEFEILAGKLGVEQRNLATDADRALLLLKEDGSSIAFPEMVLQMRDDMFQVSSRLTAVKVGTTTQLIEADIIETLNDLVQALIQAQEDQENKDKKPSPSGKQRQPGDQPLVDRIAELKMVRGLQVRINKRHKRYAQQLKNPDDPVGFSDDPEVTAALDRLSERQLKVQTITRDIAKGKNQ